MNMNLPFWEIRQCHCPTAVDRFLLGLSFFFSFACLFLPLHTQETYATEPSPPSSQLAFAAYLEGSWDFFVVSDNGTGLKRLTNTPFDERNPSWSQDRNSIVYSTSDGHIHRYDLVAEKDVLLKTLKGVNVQPAFMPDGQDVLYVHFSEDVPDDTDLYLLDIKTGKSRLFLGQRSQQFYPCWSPNGEHMAYINVLCSNPCDRMIQEVWVTDRFGKNARQLILTNSACETPAWSPDGRRLALSSDLSGNFDIYIYDIVNRTLKPITTDPHSDTSPAWSPDGSKLAFVSTRSGQSEIWIKDLISDNLKRFVPFPGQVISCKDVTW